MKKILLLSGTARAGTSSLVEVLNLHNHILMGQERYYYPFQNNTIRAADFEKDRFLDVREGDTHRQGGLKPRNVEPARRYDNAIYIGDKFPPLFRHLPHVFGQFPDAQHIYILRNPLSVVESYDARFRDPDDNWNLDWRAGLKAWNDSVRTVAALPEERLARFLFVQYEEIFASPKALNALFTRLGLSNLEEERLAPFTTRFRKLSEQSVPRREDLRVAVSREADWESYRILSRRMPGMTDRT